MNFLQKRRLYFIGLLILSSVVAGSLIIYALGQNINFFYTPSQIHLNEAPAKTRFRVGGLVEKGSLKREENLKVEFIITDLNRQITIQYVGILPDLFKEGKGVVASGKLLNNRIFLADEILAKHDENYLPPEVATTLKYPSGDNHGS